MTRPDQERVEALREVIRQWLPANFHGEAELLRALGSELGITQAHVDALRARVAYSDGFDGDSVAGYANEVADALSVLLAAGGEE